MSRVERVAETVGNAMVAAARCIREFALRAFYLRTFVRKEIRDLRVTSWSSKLAMWPKGFASRNRLIYAFDDANPDDYLSDLQNDLRVRRINGPYAFLLDDKLAFHQMFVASGVLPRHFGLVRRGHFLPLGPPEDAPVSDVEALLEREERIVLKRVTGFGAEGMLIAESRNGEVFVNGEPIAPGAFEARVRDLDGYLVCAFIRQHPTWDAIHPDTVNPLRVLTLWDVERGEPFVARAVQRFATKAFRRWSGGALGANVDLQTGRMGPGVTRHREVHERHPDSGARIEGVGVPHWPTLERRLLELCREVPFLPQIAWDLVATADGFQVLEGNNHGALPLLQVHGGLLADPRVRAFFRAHGVL